MSSATTIYDFIVKDADGKDVSLEKYRFVSKLICCLLLKIKIISTVVFLFDYGIDLKWLTLGHSSILCKSVGQLFFLFMKLCIGGLWKDR